MATGYTDEATNFFRFQCLLIDVGTEVLREVFASFYPNKTLQVFLQETHQQNTLLQLRSLTSAQMDLLYPSHGVPDINMFDISLLYALIRNLHPAVPTGDNVWLNPLVSDLSQAADVAHIREMRNSLTAHTTKVTMSDSDYQAKMTELESIFRRLLQGLNSPGMTISQLNAQIQQVQSSSPDPRRERELQQLFQTWKTTEELELRQIKEDVEYLREKQKDGFQDTEVRLQQQDKRFEALEDQMQKQKAGFEGIEDKLQKHEELIAHRELLEEDKDRDISDKVRKEVKDFTDVHSDVFTETDGFRKAQHLLKTTRVVILSGNPGSGKTFLAKHLLHAMMKEQPTVLMFDCFSAEEFKVLNFYKNTCVVFVDDFCGKYGFENLELGLWKKLGEKLHTYLRNGQLHLIITVRNIILLQIQELLTKSERLFDILAKSNEINLSKTNLTVKEKHEMLQKYNITGTEGTLKKLTENTNLAAPIGFPFLCKMASGNMDETDLVRIFSDVSYLSDELKMLHKTDKTSYLILVEAMRSKRKKFNYFDTKVHDCSLMASKLQGILDAVDMKHKCEAMVGSYFIEIELGVYHLIHKSVEEAIFASFRQEYPLESISFSPAEMLCNLVEAERDKDISFSIEQTEYQNLMERFLALLISDEQNIADTIAQAKIWKSESFCQYFGRSILNEPFRTKFSEVLKHADLLPAFAASDNETLTKSLAKVLQINFEEIYPLQIKRSIDRASSFGLDKIVRFLVELGISPNPDAVLYAAESGSVAVIEILVSSGCDADFANSERGTIMHVACQFGHKKLVEFLIEHHPLMLHKKCKGLTPLFVATIEGYIDIVKLLLGLNSIDPLDKTDEGHSLLYKACKSSQSDTVLYIENKYPEMVKILAKDNSSVIHMAARFCDITVLKYLAEKLDCRGKEFLKDYCSPSLETGATPLHHASAGGNVENLKYLVDIGLSVDEVTNTGQTLLHRACLHGKLEMVKYLMTHYSSMKVKKDKNGNSCIRPAAASGCVEVLEYLIDTGLSVDEITNNGETLLHRACLYGKLEMVKYLLAHYSSMKVKKDKNGNSCIHHSAAGGSVEVLEYLVDTGLSVDEVTKTGETLLHRACLRGEFEMVKYLMTHYSSMKVKKDKNGNSCIHHAATGGHVEVLEYLVDTGLSVDEVTKTGETLLHRACLRGELEMVKYLMTHYSSMKVKKDKNGNSCIHHAATGGSVKVLEYLFDTGLSVDEVTNTGETLLHRACFRGRFEMVKYLMTHYSSMKVKKDKNGNSCIHHAASGGSVKVLEYLVDTGLSVDEVTKTGETLLHNACFRGRFEMVNYLMTHFSSMKVKKDKNGNSCIHHAAAGGSVEVLEYLVDTGLSVDEVTNNGETLLHRACLHGELEMVKYLMTHYSSMKVKKGMNGNSCIHHAADGGSVEVLEYLVDTGLSVDEVTNTGETLLHRACLYGKFEMMKYLMKHYSSMKVEKDKNGNSCIHHAVDGGSVEVLEYLVDTGLSVDKVINTGETLLYRACLHGKLEMVKYLMTHYSSMKVKNDKNGNSCIHHAAAGGSVEVLEYLVDIGLSVDEVTNTGETLLHRACLHGELEIVKYLMTHYSSMKVKKDKNGNSCIDDAAGGGSVEVLEYLVDTGLSVDEVTKTGETLLHRACLHGKFEMMKYLMTHYGSMKVKKDKNGNSCIHHAASGGSVEVLEYLVYTGLSVDEVTNTGETLLHRACLHGKLEMVKYLMTHYSSMKVRKDKNGNSCIHHAADGGHVEVLGYLVDTGLSVDEVTNTGETLLQRACLHGKLEMVKYLMTHYSSMKVKKDKNGCSCLHSAAAGGSVEILEYLFENGMRTSEKTKSGKMLMKIAQTYGNDNAIAYLKSVFETGVTQTTRKS